MAALSALTLLGLVSAVAGIQVHDDPAIQHNLTICNAYADRKPLSVYTMTNKAKLTEEPLAYKSCKMLSLELAEGERIDFKLGGLSVGTFKATGLPFTAASLLLVPYHRGNGTMSAAFASHSFSLAEQSQLAIVDAYSGKESGGMKIQVGAKKARQAQSSELKSGSSVSLAAGKYLITLEDESGRTVKSTPLSAADNTKYVAMRVGLDSEGMPQELVVASSQGEIVGHHAGSGSPRASLGAFVAAAAAAVLAAVAA